MHRFRYLLPESAQTLCYGGGTLVNLRTSRAAKLKVPAFVAAEWASTVTRLRQRTDLVHAHWLLPQGFVAAGSTWRTPFVLTVHGGDVFALRGKLLDRFSRFAVNRAAGVTVGSSVTTSPSGPSQARLTTSP